MTTQEFIDYFAILQDKYGSPNLLEDEVVLMGNHAYHEFLNRLFPDTLGGIANVETDINVLSPVQPLIFTITENMDSTGLLANADLNAALATESGDSDATYFRILSIGIDNDGVEYPVRFAKHNNIFAYKRNFFKNPDLSKARFSPIGKGFQFYPIDEAADLTITVVKNPKLMSLSPTVDPELDNYSMYQVLAIALQLAGVSTRDTEILQDMQGISLQAK